MFEVTEQHSLSTETETTPVPLEQETSSPAITDIPPGSILSQYPNFVRVSMQRNYVF